MNSGFESRPATSTPEAVVAEPAIEEVGAHQFRNHFGYYLDRAAAGNEVLVHRRGHPCARFVPRRLGAECVAFVWPVLVVALVEPRSGASVVQCLPVPALFESPETATQVGVFPPSCRRQLHSRQALPAQL
jgi:prevent-host-death family protein